MSAKLKIKRGTSQSWADSTNKDTTLEPGQLGVEYKDNGSMRLKVGKHTDDGSATDWASLPYTAPNTDVYKDDAITPDMGTVTSSSKVTKSFEISPKLVMGSNVSSNSGSYTQVEIKPMYIVKSSSGAVSETTPTLVIAPYSSNYGLIVYPQATGGSNYSKLGTSDNSWYEGYIRDAYMKSSTYENQMQIRYNSGTESLEFISL